MGVAGRNLTVLTPRRLSCTVIQRLAWCVSYGAPLDNSRVEATTDAARGKPLWPHRATLGNATGPLVEER